MINKSLQCIYIADSRRLAGSIRLTVSRVGPAKAACLVTREARSSGRQHMTSDSCMKTGEATPLITSSLVIERVVNQYPAELLHKEYEPKQMFLRALTHTQACADTHTHTHTHKPVQTHTHKQPFTKACFQAHNMSERGLRENKSNDNK